MPQPVTTEMLARAGATLAEGGWRFTRRQLYYATCAAAETTSRSPARGQFASGVLLGLVAIILLPFRPASLAVGGLAAIALAAGMVTVLTRRPRVGRVLAVSFSEFESLLSDAQSLPGLIDTAAAPPPAPSAGDLAGSPGLVVVCDTAESAAGVSANFDIAGIDPIPVRTLDGDGLRGVTVVALHDASPRGCALPLELQDAGARVVDAGLRPAWVDRSDVQVLEGAPARMPRELTQLVGEDELDWLRSGRRVELAVLPPQRLMELVQAGVARARALPDPSPDSVAAAAPLEAPFLAGQLRGLA